MTQLIAVFALVGASFLLGLSVRRRHDPLYDHDPNKPFTRDELRKMGIKPPDDYEKWLKRHSDEAVPDKFVRETVKKYFSVRE